MSETDQLGFSQPIKCDRINKHAILDNMHLMLLHKVSSIKTMHVQYKRPYASKMQRAPPPSSPEETLRDKLPLLNSNDTLLMTSPFPVKLKAPPRTAVKLVQTGRITSRRIHSVLVEEADAMEFAVNEVSTIDAFVKDPSMLWRSLRYNVITRHNSR